MSATSQIQWTNATWNVSTGCTKVSPECAHCYIEETPPFRIAGRKFVKGATDFRLHEERLEWPLRWNRPRRIFVNSLSDLFHEDMPDDFIDKVFAVMALCQQHTFQVLTKRAVRMREYITNPTRALSIILKFGKFVVPRGLTAVQEGQRRVNAIADGGWPLPNVWLGVSAGNRRMWAERVPELLKTPAPIHWVSIEPILEDMVDELFTICLVTGWIEPPYDDKVDWVVVGGESGTKARPTNIAHIGRVVEACQQWHTPVFVKQFGSNAHFPNIQTKYPLRDRKGGNPGEWPEYFRVREYPR